MTCIEHRFKTLNFYPKHPIIREVGIDSSTHLLKKTMTKIIVIVLLCITVCTSITHADRFRGKILRVDTHIGTNLSPVNANQINLPTLLQDETFQIELFIEGTRSNRTRGYTIAFDNTNNRFGDYFRIVKIAGLLPQQGLPGPTSVKAVSDKPATISTNDYIATITLAVKRNLLAGLQLSFDQARTQIVDEYTGQNDTLHVASAIVSFGQPTYSLSLDLDTAPDDQKLLKSYGNAKEILVQVFGQDVKFMTGFILRFEFDASQMAFESFEIGTLLPNMQTLDPIQTSLDSPFVDVEVTAASFGNSATTENGLLGTLKFTPQSEFSSASIRLTAAEIRRGGKFLPFFTPLTVDLVSLDADFNDDGFVDFRDFLLFAERFGSQRNDDLYNPRYDLVPDSSINFADFLLFTESLAFFRVVVLD